MNSSNMTRAERNRIRRFLRARPEESTVDAAERVRDELDKASELHFEFDNLKARMRRRDREAEAMREIRGWMGCPDVPSAVAEVRKLHGEVRRLRRDVEVLEDILGRSS